ncbi:MAG: ABC transporter ATP-binding protein [Clostridia bacterium]|nr:ABC transporter ATP-binding protein [Clostridia bacterium]
MGAEGPVFLAVRDVVRRFPAPGRRQVVALDGVSLELREGESLGLVGESGSGKTTLARLVLRLLPPTDGQVLYRGKPLWELRGADLARFRREVQPVFQDPDGALNPRLSVGASVAEPLAALGLGDRRQRRRRVAEVLEAVGLPAAVAAHHPYALSGGQRQRAAIARALAAGPRLLVLDEPVSALDVPTRAQILDLLLDLRARLGLSYLVIAHDLGFVSRLAERLAVLYAGRLVEIGPTAAVTAEPRHPYTRLLLASAPSLARPGVLPEAPAGEPPDAAALPAGCPFHPRCPLRHDRCVVEVPRLRPAGPGRAAACHESERQQG